jgi:hypothetical protein
MLLRQRRRLFAPWARGWDPSLCTPPWSIPGLRWRSTLAASVLRGMLSRAGGCSGETCEREPGRTPSVLLSPGVWAWVRRQPPAPRSHSSSSTSICSSRRAGPSRCPSSRWGRFCSSRGLGYSSSSASRSGGSWARDWRHDRSGVAADPRRAGSPRLVGAALTVLGIVWVGTGVLDVLRGALALLWRHRDDSSGAIARAARSLHADGGSQAAPRPPSCSSRNSPGRASVSRRCTVFDLYQGLRRRARTLCPAVPSVRRRLGRR